MTGGLQVIIQKSNGSTDFCYEVRRAIFVFIPQSSLLHALHQVNLGCAVLLLQDMEKGCKVSGVKVIRLHDLRHSHVSLLIDMGFSALAIADRVGHESIDITFRYAHLFPTRQIEMADKLDMMRSERGA